MKVPDSALPYILLQRTGILRHFGQAIAEHYAAAIGAEIEAMRPFLPETAINILDIGCGVGGADVFLSEIYGHKANLHLVDGTGLTETRYGYEDEMEPYNSMGVALELLSGNEIEDRRVYTYTPGYLPSADIDLAVSLLSWGFHYPILTYAKGLKEILTGRLILDLRNNPDLKTRRAELDEYFDFVGIVSENSKAVRVCYEART